MKKTFLAVYALMLISNLCGCKRIIIGNNEINEITYPGAVAVDIAPWNKEMVLLTIASDRGAKGGGGGGGGGGSGVGEIKGANVIYTEGRTVFEANRATTSNAEKDIHWGHNEYIIIGEEAAKEDILKYLDFFVRNHENRLTTKVVVSKETTGTEIIKKIKTEQSVSGKFEELFDNAGSLSMVSKVKLSELIEKLDQKYSAALIPCIHIAKKHVGDSQKGQEQGQQSSQEKDKSQAGKQGAESGEKESEVLSTNGYGVIKGKRLIGFISGDKARGLSWITNDIRSAIIVALDETGNYVSLEVVDATSEIKTKLEDEQPSINIKVRVKSNIVEMFGQSNIFSSEAIEKLNEQQTNIVKSEIESIIEYARENNVDIFGFGDKIFHQHPVKWEKVKDKWDEVFPNIKYNIEVESSVNRVYNIKQPIQSREENKE